MPYFMSFILWLWKLPEAASTLEQVVWGNPNLCFRVRVTTFGSRINSLFFPLRWELRCIDKHIHFHSLNFSKPDGAGKPRAGCPAYSRPSIMWSSPDLCFEQVQDPPLQSAQRFPTTLASLPLNGLVNPPPLGIVGFLFKAPSFGSSLLGHI